MVIRMTSLPSNIQENKNRKFWGHTKAPGQQMAAVSRACAGCCFPKDIHYTIG